MNAPGKSMIKVVSILMLIFSSISLIVLFVSLIGSAYIEAYHLGVGVILIFALIISFASVIFEFIAAILGLKHCGRPEKANSLFGIGVTLIIIAAVSILFNIISDNFSVLNLVSLVLPILYTVGASQNKNAANINI